MLKTSLHAKKITTEYERNVIYHEMLFALEDFLVKLPARESLSYYLLLRVLTAQSVRQPHITAVNFFLKLCVYQRRDDRSKNCQTNGLCYPIKLILSLRLKKTSLIR